MKKKQVTHLFINCIATYFNVSPSPLGKSSPKEHPARGIAVQIKGQRLNSLRIGDILRCDGLPFASRPVTTISKIEGSKLKIYDPVRIENGLWVLRERG